MQESEEETIINDYLIPLKELNFLKDPFPFPLNDKFSLPGSLNNSLAAILAAVPANVIAEENEHEERPD